MEYWCYFLHKLPDTTLKQIISENIITIPSRERMEIGDKIIIYVLGRFIGYFDVIGTVKKNKKLDGTIIHDLFDLEELNTYKVSVKTMAVVTRCVLKKYALNNNDQFIKIFDRFKKLNKYVLSIGSDMGKCICDILEKEYESEQEDLDNSKKKVKKKEVEILDEYQKKSQYIIPIIIVPCHIIKLKLKKCSSVDRIQELLDHSMSCRECHINNNNERVTIDLIHNSIIKYYKMTDTVETTTLINIYQSLSFYEYNKITLIKICDTTNKYYGCYFIVGKMDKEL
jgi:hypothetical protein